jgi:hypothetical protein
MLLRTGKLRPTFGGRRRPFAVVRQLTGPFEETDDKQERCKTHLSVPSVAIASAAHFIRKWWSVFPMCNGCVILQ